MFASWGSLAHITIAEPGALIGFLGPKVYELLEGKPFPPNVQTAENLADRGIIDAVVLPDELPLLVDRALGLLVDPPTPQTRELRTGEVAARAIGVGVDPDHPRPGIAPAYARCCATAATRPCACRAPRRASATAP